MGKTASPPVLILMGSSSDFERVEEAEKELRALGLSCEMHVASAHRSPEHVARLAREARGRGVKVIVAAAGRAAHLAGAVAANTTLPVIGLPIGGGPLSGLDALLSTVQMPSGIPVATVAIDGACNAALLAAEIIAVTDDEVAARLAELRERLSGLVDPLLPLDVEALRKERGRPR